MEPTANISRRAFLARTAATAGGLAVGSALPILGADDQAAPSERIGLAFIGAGRIAKAHIGGFLGQSDVQVIAVCDINSQRRDALIQRINKHYGHEDCRGCHDFREMVTQPDIDAVVVATPDHWHALQIIAAARAGKHVYSEKPLARTVAEGRATVEAVKQHGIVHQHGTQQRSSGRFRFACELVRNGRIGELRTVRVAVTPGRVGPDGAPEPVPDYLDWDSWLGPAPWAPYSAGRLDCRYWVNIQDYSAGGYVSTWGIHHVDIAQWGMGTELTGPVEIEGTGVFPTTGICDTPRTWHVEYHCGTGAKVIFTTPNEAAFGVTFEGSEGTVFVNRGQLRTEPESLANEVIGPDEIHLYRSHSHHRNWLDCIRTGGQTAAPPEIAHRSSTICYLSDIAIRLGRKLRWDPKAERVVDDDAANRMLSCAMREPWIL